MALFMCSHVQNKLCFDFVVLGKSRQPEKWFKRLTTPGQ